MKYFLPFLVLCVAASGPPMPPADKVMSPRGEEVFVREVAVEAVVSVPENTNAFRIKDTGTNLLFQWAANPTNSNTVLSSSKANGQFTGYVGQAWQSNNWLTVAYPATSPTFYRLASSPRGTASVTLVWHPSGYPSNIDASVTGYRIYYGIASRNYTNIFEVGNHTNCTISNLVGWVGYYFAATAYNVLGMESDYSNEAMYLTP